jgi:DNA-binding LacI/PurR family transcriptional regulator
MPMTANQVGGRVAVRVAADIMARYIDQVEEPLVFLPPQRALVEEFDVSLSTLRRALAMLETRGAIRAEHGRGCRILRPRGNDLFRVAVLQATQRNFGRTTPPLIDAIQQNCLRRKWQVLVMDIEEMNPSLVLRALLDAHVDAVALVVESHEIMQTLLDAGILCVAVESDVRDLPIDQVYQNNFGAAEQAASYLLNKGHRRLGWIGPVQETHTAFMRFCGARMAHIARQLDLDARDILPGEPTQDSVEAYLSSPDRPRAMLTLWHDATIALLRAAARLGIDDLDVVGWGVDKQADEIAAVAGGCRIDVAAMIWHVDEMAEVVASRLQLHRVEQKLQPIHLVISSRLVPQAELSNVVRRGVEGVGAEVSSGVNG